MEWRCLVSDPQTRGAGACPGIDFWAASICRSPLLDVGTVRRGRGVDAARRICRNQLDRDGACLDRAFVPDDVHMSPPGSTKPIPSV